MFVYGTLMGGGANHHVLRSLGATFVGRARTSAPRTLIDLGPYPAMTNDSTGPCPITGEVWAIDPARLGALDRFEGVPSLYRRETISVVLEGKDVEVETYVFAGEPSDGAIIPSGSWSR